MKRACIFLLISLCAVLPVSAAYRGHVFIDSNKNGIFDAGEKTLSGVCVSDGLHVVKTLSDGSFSLPGHTKERFIFVSVPSGFKTVKNHFIPIQSGQPSYNFALTSYNEGISKDGSHSFIQITDTEIFNTSNHEDWVGNIRKYAANEKASFIIHTGDICYEKGLREHINLMNNSTMNRPVFYCIGNHDLVEGAYAEELFESIYGPVFYSFDMGNTHYIVTPMLNGDHQPSYTKEDVYRWMKNDLAQLPKGKPVIVFSHGLLTHSDTFNYGISPIEQINLNSHNLKAWIYGHWHMNYMRKQGNVYTICTGTPDKGSIDHSPNVFRMIHVDARGNISSRLRHTYINKHIEIASPGNDGYPVLISGSVPLTVNTYHSDSPTSEVVYSCLVDGKKLFANRKLTQKTDWSWSDMVYLTHKPVGKTITIQVEATFNNGEKAKKEVRFTYPDQRPKTDVKEDWKNLRGNPQHTGVTSTVIKPPLKMAWVSNIGANIGMTSPIVYKGRIFIASMDEDLKGKAYIYALNSLTGDLLWKYPVNNSIKNTIVVDDDIVFAQTVQGSLYGIKVEDGSLKWGTQLHVNELPALIDGIVISDGVIYAGSGNGLCALDSRTGEVLWENSAWSQGEGTTSTLTVGKGILIGSAQWRGLYGNDVKTGELKWQLNKNGLKNRGASAAVYENLLYVISDKSLFIIEASNGNVIVRKEFPFNLDVTSSPLLTDDAIIFGSVNNGIIAVDKETLEPKWQFQTGDALIYTAPYTRKVSATVETSPVLSGETVYFGASDGCLYGINKTNGELIWKHSTGAPILSSVAISGNTLIATDLGGNIYTFVTSK